MHGYLIDIAGYLQDLGEERTIQPSGFTIFSKHNSLTVFTNFVKLAEDGDPTRIEDFDIGRWQIRGCEFRALFLRYARLCELHDGETGGGGAKGQEG